MPSVAELIQQIIVLLLALAMQLGIDVGTYQPPQTATTTTQTVTTTPSGISVTSMTVYVGNPRRTYGCGGLKECAVWSPSFQPSTVGWYGKGTTRYDQSYYIIQLTGSGLAYVKLHMQHEIPRIFSIDLTKSVMLSGTAANLTFTNTKEFTYPASGLHSAQVQVYSDSAMTKLLTQTSLIKYAMDVY